MAGIRWRDKRGGREPGGKVGWQESVNDHLMEPCTTFVLCSQYVLFDETVLACFDPRWPSLKSAVA
jgi:hypothetical protein